MAAGRPMDAGEATVTAGGPAVRMLPSLEGTRWAHLEVDRQVHDLPVTLDAAAERWGDRTLWHFPELGTSATYAQVRDQTRVLAGGLRAIDVRSGSRVGLMLGNVPEFPLTWLALARLGAVSVPLNPRLTPREIEFVADDTGMTHLVADATAWRRVQNANGAWPLPDGCVVIVIDGAASAAEVSFETLLAGDPDGVPPTSPGPGALLSIQFTSGTTGLPKGCLLTHEYWISLGRTFAALTDYPQRVLADYPFFYMQNQGYLTTAMAGGGQIVVTHGLSLRSFLGWLHDYEIDMAWVSGALLSLPSSPADRTHKLRLAPADEIGLAEHAVLEDRFGFKVREWYASTEAGMGTLVPWEDDGRVGSGTIGVPAPFRETRVIDSELADVQPGVVGELCLRGPGMMLGYHNRPETNAELFLDGGWFRTGDLVRKDADGYHYFAGRIKDMVRRSGENIAAQEVEEVLRQMPRVADVAVVGVPEPLRGEEVMAFLVLDPALGETLTPDEVWDWCGTRLAPFKAPRFLRVVEEFPRTSSGKIAKAQLKAMTAISAGKVVDRLHPDEGAWT